MTSVMKRSQSESGEVQAAHSTAGKKLVTATGHGRQPAGTVSIRGPGSCLHLGGQLPRRSLCTPIGHSFGKNPPVESGLSRHEKEEVHSFSGSRAGCQAPLVSKDRTQHFPRSLLPSAPQPHHTAKQRWPQCMQPLQRQAREQVRLRSAGGQSTTGRGRGSLAEVGAEGRTPRQPPVLGACCTGSRRALAHGQRKGPRG